MYRSLLFYNTTQCDITPLSADLFVTETVT